MHKLPAGEFKAQNQNINYPPLLHVQIWVIVWKFKAKTTQNVNRVCYFRNCYQHMHKSLRFPAELIHAIMTWSGCKILNF